jgi:hypothetical protein
VLRPVRIINVCYEIAVTNAFVAGQQDVAVKTEPHEGGSSLGLRILKYSSSTELGIESEYRPSKALLQSFAMLEQDRLDHGG